MSNYIMQIENDWIVFSDEHYRHKAIEFLRALNAKIEGIERFDCNLDVPHILLRNIDQKRLAFEFGCLSKNAEEKYSVALREQKEQREQREQAVKDNIMVKRVIKVDNGVEGAFMKREEDQSDSGVKFIPNIEVIGVSASKKDLDNFYTYKDSEVDCKIESARLVEIYTRVKSKIDEKSSSEENFSLNQYVQDACRTECEYNFELKDRLLRNPGLLHGIIGLQTEIGELADAVKRYVFYGKELDKTNVGEELGDLAWYAAIICKHLGLNFEEILKKNIEKLRVRYPEKFTEDCAINRDIDKEREVL